MTVYAAPLADMRFLLGELVDLDRLIALAGNNADRTAIDQVLEEAGRFAAEVLAPLNAPGDIEGSRLANGVVTTPGGFSDAYRRFVAAGWSALPFAADLGGPGLPRVVATAANEMWGAANMAFSLCPLLTQSAVELLAVHASPAQKARYLDHLVSGEWTATMCLTEPQAGSDVGALVTRAVPEDGRYRLRGTKIFITYGEHDLADNIVHLVLARTPDAPPGIKGLSLFIVPKFLVGEDGRRGARNDLRALALEHKLGIRASPTCVMAFGEGDGAQAELVGEVNQGMAAMLTMMNSARLVVGLEGVGVAERAYQQARAYAAERRQGRRLDGQPARLIDHADVRRLLLTMKAETEAMRGLAYLAAEQIDIARRDPDPGTRARAEALVGLLTPVVKGYGSDLGFDIASRNIQILGGVGYIESTGAPQHLRDARVAAIYEGANGIQALDLVRRKLAQHAGRAVHTFLAQLGGFDRELAEAPELDSLRRRLGEGVDALATATRWLIGALKRERDAALAGASDYLKLFGVVACGYVMARAALKARARLEGGSEAPLPRGFYQAKLITARIFADRVLPQAQALLGPLTSGAVLLRAIDDAQL